MDRAPIIGWGIFLVLTMVTLSGCMGGTSGPSDQDPPTTQDFDGPSSSSGPSPSTTAPRPSASPSGTTSPPSTTTAAPPTTSPPPGSGGNGSGQPRPFEPEEPEGSCGTFDSFTPVLPTQGTQGIVTGWELLSLDVAIIADATFVRNHSTDWGPLLMDLVNDASAHYEEQVGLRLVPALVDHLPEGSLEPGTGDNSQRDVARGFMHARHPNADVDVVAVILGADYRGGVAGEVECVHGAKYPEYSYLWAEYTDNRTSLAFLDLGFFQDVPLKVFMHELGHLLAAHHHYSNCGEAVALYYRTDDLTGVCDIMINDVGLASFHFGPVNRLVMRSFVEEIGIGEPVE